MHIQTNTPHDPARLPNTPAGWPLESMPADVLAEMLDDTLRYRMARWLGTWDTVGLAYDQAQPPEPLGWPEVRMGQRHYGSDATGQSRVELRLAQDTSGNRWATVMFDVGTASPAGDPGLYFASAEAAAAVLDQYQPVVYWSSTAAHQAPDPEPGLFCSSPGAVLVGRGEPCQSEPCPSDSARATVLRGRS